MTGRGPLCMGSSLLRVWGISVNSGGALVWHKLLWLNCWCFCLCGGLHDCSSRPAFTVGHRQGSFWVGPAASGVDLLGFLQHGLHWLGWGYFCPIGWHCGCKDLSLFERDEQLHCLAEFLYTSHQTTRLAGDWGMHLLSLMLQSPCVGDSMMQLGKTDVLGAEPYVPW